MFEGSNSKDKNLTALNLGNPPRRSVPTTPVVKAGTEPEVKPAPVQVCVARVQTLEGEYEQFIGTQRNLEELTRAGLKPAVLFYVVFPQQGLTFSFTTADGLKTIVPLFNSQLMAEAYISGRKLAAVAAACRIEDLPSQAEQWITSGINSYSLNACCKCLSLRLSPVADLQSEEAFLATWRLDLANRRNFAQGYGRNASQALSSNQKQARIWFESIRDHIDPANPYLHWVIAILAGMAGDTEGNAVSIKRLEAFGPPFAGKLQGTSFDPSVPGSQLSTLPEAMLGLGVSLGYIDSNRVPQGPK